MVTSDQHEGVKWWHWLHLSRREIGGPNGRTSFPTRAQTSIILRPKETTNRLRHQIVSWTASLSDWGRKCFPPLGRESTFAYAVRITQSGLGTGQFEEQKPWCDVQAIRRHCPQKFKNFGKNSSTQIQQKAWKVARKKTFCCMRRTMEMHVKLGLDLKMGLWRILAVPQQSEGDGFTSLGSGAKKRVRFGQTLVCGFLISLIFRIKVRGHGIL